jgi:hypothetical protein
LIGLIQVDDSGWSRCCCGGQVDSEGKVMKVASPPAKRSGSGSPCPGITAEPPASLRSGPCDHGGIAARPARRSRKTTARSAVREQVLRRQVRLATEAARSTRCQRPNRAAARQLRRFVCRAESCCSASRPPTIDLPAPASGYLSARRHAVRTTSAPDRPAPPLWAAKRCSDDPCKTLRRDVTCALLSGPIGEAV